MSPPANSLSDSPSSDTLTVAVLIAGISVTTRFDERPRLPGRAHVTFHIKTGSSAQFDALPCSAA